MRTALKRIVLVLAIAEIAYLSLINLALNLPLAQSLINQHRPDQYAVHWERAWSWYPLRVHARGIAVDGQTSSQQYQAELSSASASVALLPLLRKRVQVSDVDAVDVVVRLRPRPMPENDFGEIRAVFPPIHDRDPLSSAVDRGLGAEPREGKGWTIAVDDIHVRGTHDVWVFQVRGALEGDLRASLSFETKGGPFSLRGGEADVGLSSLILNQDWEVSNGGSLKGRFELAPFVPSENPGLKVLEFLSVDADLDAPVGSLEFLDFYLRGFNGLDVDGKGRLKGHLKYNKGSLISGTDLSIAADELALVAAPYEAKGEGRIDIAVDPEDPESLHLGILFGALQARHQDDEVPLFAGEGLAVDARGPTRVLPVAERNMGRGRLAVTIPSVVVPDLGAFQRYLPDKWGVRLHGGEGTLSGRAEYSAKTVQGELGLVSSDADLGIKDYRFRTNLDLGLRVGAGVSQSAAVDLSGTYLRLDGARLASVKRGESKPWSASLTIAEGTLGVPVPQGETAGSEFSQLSGAFKKSGFKALLATADADLGARLEVSDLGWVNLLFTNPFDLAVSGSGAIAAELRIREGWLAKGTILRVQPKGLGLQVLDYEARGKGLVKLEVLKGGERPDMRLDASLGDAELKRRGEVDAFVQDVKLAVSAVAKGITLDGGGQVAALDLSIPSARVTDMSVYNQYLPKDTPLVLLGGEAELVADVHLELKSAGGFVTLKTNGLRSRLDEQEVAGRLTLDIKLQGGVPADMDFDISGSSLLLDGFKVSGQQKSFNAVGWQAKFALSRARAVWRKPIKLDLEAEVEMVDSRPIVAMFANQRGKEGWLDKVLTIRNVKGTAELKVDADRALVPYAMVGSDKIDVGVKGVIDPGGREGIFYARFHNLDGILKVRDGERNFDLLGAKETFDAYAPGDRPLKLSDSQTEPVESKPDQHLDQVQRKDADAGTRTLKNAKPTGERDPFGSFSAE